MNSFYSFLKKYHETTNNIGFVESVHEAWPATLEEVRWLKHPYVNKWFADPFIFNVTEQILEVLVEEYDMQCRKGVIVKLVIDRIQMTLIQRIPLLSLDTHLSFPFWYIDSSNLYLIPENSKANHVPLFEYDLTNERVCFLRCLIDKPLVDTVVFRYKAMWYLLGTYSQVDNCLHVFRAKSKTLADAEFEEFQVITTEKKELRNGGMIFEHEGRYYKISQNCVHHYGAGIIIHEILFSSEGKLSFVARKCFNANKLYYRFGVHSYNVMANVAVIDGKDFRYRVLGMFIEKFVSIYRRFK